MRSDAGLTNVRPRALPRIGLIDERLELLPCLGGACPKKTEESTFVDEGIWGAHPDRRAVVAPRPVLWLGAQAGADRIESDVSNRLVEMGVSEDVRVEETPLPERSCAAVASVIAARALTHQSPKTAA